MPSESRPSEEVVSALTSLLTKDLGLSLELFDQAVVPELFNDDPDLLFVAKARGAPLSSMAILTADNYVCKVSIQLGPVPELSTDQHLRLAIALLELNYTVPFGRVSFAPYSQREDRSSPADFMFVETMFFWRSFQKAEEEFKLEVAQRLVGLQELFHSSRAAIVRSLRG